MVVLSSWNVMAHGDGREGKWTGNWRKEWVARTLHTTSEHGVSSITIADAHTSAASSRLNWRSRQFKWTRPFRRKTKSGFCACAITFQTQSTCNTHRALTDWMQTQNKWCQPQGFQNRSFPPDMSYRSCGCMSCPVGQWTCRNLGLKVNLKHLVAQLGLVAASRTALVQLIKEPFAFILRFINVLTKASQWTTTLTKRCYSRPHALHRSSFRRKRLLASSSLSVRPFAREQLCSNCTDFHEILN